jgi:hypothetical protein
MSVGSSESLGIPRMSSGKKEGSLGIFCAFLGSSGKLHWRLL